MSQVLEYLLDKYGNTGLICDCNTPLITNGTVKEELLLYNICEEKIDILLEKFTILTSKKIDINFNVNHFSGGQKVILLILLALYSPAQVIVINQLSLSLDKIRYEAILKLINELQSPMKMIILLDEQ